MRTLLTTAVECDSRTSQALRVISLDSLTASARLCAGRPSRQNGACARAPHSPPGDLKVDKSREILHCGLTW